MSIEIDGIGRVPDWAAGSYPVFIEELGGEFPAKIHHLIKDGKVIGIVIDEVTGRSVMRPDSDAE